MKRRIVNPLACFITLLLLLSAGVAQEKLRYKELPNFHRINEKLYRGAQPQTNGWQILSKLGIKTVINLRDNDDRSVSEEKQVRAAGFNYFNIPMARLARPNDDKVQKALAIINTPEHQPVFVHCRHGADRTGVVIGAYRILNEGWTSERAKAEANRHGMKIWQFAMKDYLHDLYRDKKQTGN